MVFSEADYEARGPKFILTPADFDPGWTWDTTLTGIYTGVRYQYTNSDKNKTFTVKAGTEERLLTSNEPAGNLTEATANRPGGGEQCQQRHHHHEPDHDGKAGADRLGHDRDSRT